MRESRGAGSTPACDAVVNTTPASSISSQPLMSLAVVWRKRERSTWREKPKVDIS